MYNIDINGRVDTITEVMFVIYKNTSRYLIELVEVHNIISIKSKISRI